jgi:hypothetical protein
MSAGLHGVAGRDCASAVGMPAFAHVDGGQAGGD